MNEYETNPQRHEASSIEEPSPRSADAPRDSTSPERGQSDTTAQFAPSTPYPAPPAGAPAESPYAYQHDPVGQQAAAQQSGAGQAAAQQSGAGQSAYQPSPWQGGQQAYPTSAYPTSGYPTSAYPGQQGYPGYADQSQYPGQQYPGQPHPGQQYPGQPHPGQQHYAGYPSQPHEGQPHPGQPQPGQPQPGQPQPGQPQPGDQGYDGQTGQLPIWAQPVGGERPHDPARAARTRRVFATAGAAVLLALGAGGVGAYGALAFADDNPVAATRTSNSAVTRVVDRSSLAEIASTVKNSVVSITTGSGEGSGVILTADGFVVTNNHVVASAQGDTVNVVFADGKSVTAKIVGKDPATDLAVVKADNVSGLEPATFGSSANMQVGDTVVALGSPLGLEGSVTAGIVSAKDRTIRASDGGGEEQPNPFGSRQQTPPASMSGLLQTDAAINPGNSGGALVNTEGEVIGINSAIATSGGNSGNIGLGFAIPSDKVKVVADQLMKGEKVSHPALGVMVAEAEGGGAVVSAVTANSAAAKAGIKAGDVINKVNGTAINDSDDLVAVVQQGKVGDTVQVTFTRNGAPQTVNATLTEAS